MVKDQPADGDVFMIPPPDQPPDKQRLYISFGERDRELVNVAPWPEAAHEKTGGSWHVRGKHLFRHIEVRGEGPGAQSHRLWEALLPFPNSPVYGTHRPRERAFEFEHGWRNLHTMRVIGSREPTGECNPKQKIQHVYLLHNGLNETTDLLFHYRLAAWIVGERPDAVCILRPLPGHLTRFPFQGSYSEQPLDGYLRDPAELFRQFLRYMQETQWLLSALAPRSHYAVLAGTRLLAEARPRADKATGRTTRAKLAKAIKTEWDAALRGSEAAEELDDEQDYRTYFRGGIGLPAVELAIDELRSVLNWAPVISLDGPKVADGKRPPIPEAPCVHVVGYSMGGFMAQAAFFAWPFAISSCTNLFAGGALRDLAPTAFAHPEEWQSVLHGLRYELDRAFRENYLAAVDGRVAGVIENDFGYFTRIFYEVYLQYYRGGYASRVSEYSRRMLFIVGGGDPIVRTQNVLDAGPPEGMTLLQIADVSHFPSGRSHGAPDGGRVEREQRQYWLPEVGRVIWNFSERAEVLLHKTLAASWDADKDHPVTAADATPQEADAPPLEPPPDEDPTMLASMSFAHELRALVECPWSEQPAEPDADSDAAKGWLLVARNEIPPVFLGPIAFRYYGQAVHHSEEQIGQYVRTLRHRAWRLEQLKDRTSLLVPNKAERWLKAPDVQRTFFSKSETPSAARMPTSEELEEMWSQFQREWVDAGAVGLFAAQEYRSYDLGELGRIEAERLEVQALSLTVLPDVWIALSAEALGHIRGEARDDRPGNEAAIVAWAARLSERRGGGARRPARRGDGRQQDATGRLQGWLDSEDVIAIIVSAGELNPRFRGHRLRDAKDVSKTIIHWALAYAASDLGARTHAAAAAAARQ